MSSIATPTQVQVSSIEWKTQYNSSINRQHQRQFRYCNANVTSTHHPPRAQASIIIIITITMITLLMLPIPTKAYDRGACAMYMVLSSSPSPSICPSPSSRHLTMSSVEREGSNELLLQNDATNMTLSMVYNNEGCYCLERCQHGRCVCPFNGLMIDGRWPGLITELPPPNTTYCRMWPRDIDNVACTLFQIQ
jgi:hypothetical protein